MSRTVLSAERLRAEPGKAAVDPLRHTVGVFIDEATGPLGPTVIRIRGGEETYTQVLMDGVPINENGGFLDAQGVALVNVDRVEIARGPQSTLYGSSAISGVVQAFTRPGEPGPLRTEALLEGGRSSEFGSGARASVVAYGGSQSARFSLGVGTSYDRGPYRLPNNARSNDASLRVDLLSRGAFAWTGIARFMGVDANLPVRDPGALRAPLDPNQRQGRDRTLATVMGSWTPSSRWVHRASASWYQRDFTYDDAFDNLDQSQFSSYVFDANFHYKAVVRRAIARYVGTTAGQLGPALAGALSFGGEWQRESLRDEQSGDFGPAASSLGRPSLSGFGEGQLRVSRRLSLLSGARVEKFQGLAAAFVPRATATYDVVLGRLSLRTALSRAYKAPNIQDQFPSSAVFVTNPDLKPETSQSWEIGADLHSSRWTSALTYFTQRFDNLIRSVNYDATRQINRNLGRSKAKGLEVEVDVVPRERWSAGVEAAWLSTTIVDNGGLPAAEFPNGEPLPFRPTYTTSAYVGIPLTRALSVLVRESAVGPQTVLMDRFRGARVSIAPYGLTALTAMWTVIARSEAYVVVDNALNRRYDTAYDRGGIRRTGTLGLRLRR